MKVLPVLVEIYTKPQCPLCEDVKDVLAEVRERIEFTVVEHNILADAALYEKFRYDIPVVRVAGEVLFRHRVDPHALEVALRARGGIPVAESARRK